MCTDSTTNQGLAGASKVKYSRVLTFISVPRLVVMRRYVQEGVRTNGAVKSTPRAAVS